jgi:hypothetical protein
VRRYPIRVFVAMKKSPLVATSGDHELAIDIVTPCRRNMVGDDFGTLGQCLLRSSQSKKGKAAFPFSLNERTRTQRSQPPCVLEGSCDRTCRTAGGDEPLRLL